MPNGPDRRRRLTTVIPIKVMLCSSGADDINRSIAMAASHSNPVPTKSNRKTAGNAVAVKGRKMSISTKALDEDNILVRIENGESISQIAASFGADRSTLSKWLRADDHRSARAREARLAAAEAFDEQAERELRDAATPFELAKARELAHHLRWRAAKVNPRAYGDNVDAGKGVAEPSLVECLRALDAMEVPPHAEVPHWPK